MHFPSADHSVLLQHIVAHRKLRSGSTVEFEYAGAMTRGTLESCPPGEGRNALGMRVHVQVPVLPVCGTTDRATACRAVQ